MADSELATGVGTVEDGEENNIDQLSDHNVSDTGWDTDLDIEGAQHGVKICHRLIVKNSTPQPHILHNPFAADIDRVISLRILN